MSCEYVYHILSQVFYLNPSEQVAEKLPPFPDWTNLVFQEVMQRLVEKFGGATSMRDIFATFDRDSTETISLADFEDALKMLGFEGCVGCLILAIINSAP